MSKLHVTHIKTKLQEIYAGKIDTSDAKNPTDQENFFLTRAFAAYSLQVLALLEPDQAAAAIVDGYEDNGIDAIHFDRKNKELWIVQSKWIKAGSGEPETGEVSKFRNGINDLIEFKLERFNSKLLTKQDEIEEALGDAAVRIKLVLAYTGQDTLSVHNTRIITDLISEINDPTELATFIRFSLKQAHKAIVGFLSGSPINSDITILNWGKIEEPYDAIYGVVNGDVVAQLWQENRGRLFADNIREFVGFSDVNENIRDTIINEPENFYYYNNGVTVLCSSIKKKPIGGGDKNSGQFTVEDIKIVNGAQTVGSIGNAYELNPSSVENIKVFLKFISLEHCPEDFGTNVTKKTNTQNRVDKRDFVSLDPEQDRLKTEFALNGVNYHYKRSNESTKNDMHNCYVEEVITALACSKDNVDLAVDAKREVGKLWEDINKPPYTDLVNPSLTFSNAWRCVQVLREVNSVLRSKERVSTGREKSNYIHANRFILHIVFQILDKSVLLDPNYDFESYKSHKLSPLINSIAEASQRTLEKMYKTSLIHQIYRNYTKCRAIKESLMKQSSSFPK